MSTKRLEIVGSPEMDYCTNYHCAGDCGQPHNDRERAAYVAHALYVFDSLERKDKRELIETRKEVERKARKQL